MYNGVHDILETNDSLIEIAKTKAENITVSSICPRNTAVKTQTSIDALNAGLQDLCATKGCDYVDQRGSFTLGDGSINDGYILPDGVHLNRSGANRLAKNLKLKVKDNVKTLQNRENTIKRNPSQAIVITHLMIWVLHDMAILVAKGTLLALPGGQETQETSAVTSLPRT